MAVKYVKDFSFPASGGFHGSVQRYAKGGVVSPSKAPAPPSRTPGIAVPVLPNPPGRAGTPYVDAITISGKPNLRFKDPRTGKPYYKIVDQAGRDVSEEYRDQLGYAKGGRVPGYDMDRLPAKNPPGRKMDLARSKPEKGANEGYAKGGKVKKVQRYAKAGVVSPSKSPAPPSRTPGIAVPVLPNPPGRKGVPYVDAITISGKPNLRFKDPRSGKPYYKIVDQAGRDVSEEYRDQLGYAKGGKVAKVMREYKEGKLHSGSKKGPMVKNRKQAVAIALSEARKAGANIPKKAKGGTMTAQERRALDKMRFAERYAPGLSLDMPGKRKRK